METFFFYLLRKMLIKENVNKHDYNIYCCHQKKKKLKRHWILFLIISKNKKVKRHCQN